MINPCGWTYTLSRTTRKKEAGVIFICMCRILVTLGNSLLALIFPLTMDVAFLAIVKEISRVLLVSVILIIWICKTNKYMPWFCFVRINNCSYCRKDYQNQWYDQECKQKQQAVAIFVKVDVMSNFSSVFCLQSSMIKLMSQISTLKKIFKIKFLKIVQKLPQKYKFE